MTEADDRRSRDPQDSDVPASAVPTSETAYARLRKAVTDHHPGADLEALGRAYRLVDAHRADVMPPVDLAHALATAQVLADMKLDPPAVIAALVAPIASMLDQEDLSPGPAPGGARG